jgi:hypothetical protein
MEWLQTAQGIITAIGASGIGSALITVLVMSSKFKRTGQEISEAVGAVSVFVRKYERLLSDDPDFVKSKREVDEALESIADRMEEPPFSGIRWISPLSKKLRGAI